MTLGEIRRRDSYGVCRYCSVVGGGQFLLKLTAITQALSTGGPKQHNSVDDNNTGEVRTPH